jgi:hypothetical protein
MDRVHVGGCQEIIADSMRHDIGVARRRTGYCHQRRDGDHVSKS